MNTVIFHFLFELVIFGMCSYNFLEVTFKRKEYQYEICIIFFSPTGEIQCSLEHSHLSI